MAATNAQVALGVLRRKHIMRYIREYRRLCGMSPSAQEIADAVGFTKSAVRRHVDILIAEGKLTETVGTYRSIRPTRRKSPA